jgi:hypothetical protein
MQAVEQKRTEAQQAYEVAKFQTSLGQNQGQIPGGVPGGQPGVIPQNMQIDDSGAMQGAPAEAAPGTQLGQQAGMQQAGMQQAAQATSGAKPVAKPAAQPSQPSAQIAQSSPAPAMQKAASGHLGRWLRKAAQEFENQSTAEPMAEVQSLAADATSEDVPPEPTSEAAQRKNEEPLDPFAGSIGGTDEDKPAVELVDVKIDQADAPLEKDAHLARYLRKAAAYPRGASLAAAARKHMAGLPKGVKPAPVDSDPNDPKAIAQAKAFNADQMKKRKMRQRGNGLAAIGMTGVDVDAVPPPESKKK